MYSMVNNMNVENKKNIKFNIIVYLLVLLALLVMLIGTSYSYYVNKIKNEDNKNVIIEKNNIFVRYYDGYEINVNKIYPGFEMTYNFSIENYSLNSKGKYKIIFDVITPLANNIDNGFVYELSASSTSDRDIVVNKSETSIPFFSKEIGVGTIDKNALHNYKLRIILKDNNAQNYLSSKTFVGKIIVQYVYD